MRYAYKQLGKEIGKEKIFLCLLLLLSVFTSYMYYFVRFSTDGNLALLEGMEELTENQMLYQNALNSNVILARNILTGFLALSGFVYTMFYCRFFGSRKKQFGCLRTLGFTDRELCRLFVGISLLLSVFGALLGLLGAWCTADVLIRAGIQSYQVTGTVKQISGSAFLVGLLLPAAVLCLLTRCSYLVIEGKEIALLVSGIKQNVRYSRLLGFAQKVSDLFPQKQRLSVRLVLRKPVTVLLLFASVLTLAIMFLLAYSLNLSSQKVYETQIQGRTYEYELKYDNPVISDKTEYADADRQFFLEAEGVLQTGKYELEQTITGLEAGKPLYILLDKEGNSISVPEPGQVVINPAVQEVYGLNIGDAVGLSVEGKVYPVTVAAVADNADLKHVYVEPDWLAKKMSLPEGSCTGAFGTGEPGAEKGVSVVTAADRDAALRRESVSNRTSAVINQVLGVVIGSILLYLAMLLNFQDSTRDIVILHLMGRETKEIRKLLVDIYKPSLLIMFVLAIVPGVITVKGILRSLSMQIGDYMPFCTNAGVFLVIFVLVFLIYGLVGLTFGSGIRRILQREDVESYID